MVRILAQFFLYCSEDATRNWFVTLHIVSTEGVLPGVIVSMRSCSNPAMLEPS